jgi:hypothetical protein
LVLAAVMGLVVPAAADAAPSRKKAIWDPVRVDGVSQFPIYRDLGAGIYQIKMNWRSVARSRPERLPILATPRTAGRLASTTRSRRRAGTRSGSRS